MFFVPSWATLCVFAPSRETIPCDYVHQASRLRAFARNHPPCAFARNHLLCLCTSSFVFFAPSWKPSTSRLREKPSPVPVYIKLRVLRAFARNHPLRAFARNHLLCLCTSSFASSRLREKPSTSRLHPFARNHLLLPVSSSFVFFAPSWETIPCWLRENKTIIG